ncbi:2-phosphoxylose phosphatase 1-like [Tubulanus polymorphus]|uniref:2-phosphoxylose phosphatase 1-like n=1 Tax=Tubulanus polymorphus TaxID=672921 RepID=UPI003DA22DBE
MNALIISEMIKRIICWRWKASFVVFLVLILIGSHWWFSGSRNRRKVPVLLRYFNSNDHNERGVGNETLIWTSGFNNDSQADQYCNPSEAPVKGAEGLMVRMKKLISVHVFIRHGDRSPIHNLKRGGPVKLNCKINLTEYSHHKTLHSYVDNLARTSKWRHNYDAFRHTDTFPNKSDCGDGQLTPKGVVQLLDLGRYLGNIYNKELGLLRRGFLRENVLIRSTKYPRTYQSSLAFLYGFLPNFRVQDLYVTEQQTVSFCSTKHFHRPCYCHAVRKYHQLIARELKQQNRSASQRLLLELERKYQITIKETDATAFLDAVMGRYCHGKRIDVACLNSGSCNAADLISDLWKISNSYMRRQLRSVSYQRLQLLLMHPVLYEIAHRMNMNSHLPDHRQVKFVLYSGHDVSLTPLLVALGIHNTKWPPYASRLVLEQYLQESPTGLTHQIRVLYNGKDMTRKVRFCQKTSTSFTCPLSRFMRFVGTEGFQRYFGVDTFTAACQ